MMGYWLTRIAARLEERADSCINQATAETLRVIADVLRELYQHEE